MSTGILSRSSLKTTRATSLLVSTPLRLTTTNPTSRAFSTTPVAFETLKEIENRLKSVRNIGKITKSMKMIATTKLGKAQKAMTDAKAYGQANGIVFKESSIEEEFGTTGSVANDNKKVLYVVISSDKGLCGGIHSSVSKRVKAELGEGSDSQIVVVGDKPKAQLSRAIPKNIALSFNQIGRQVPNFADACSIADTIESQKFEFDKVKLIHNRWISALSYEPTVLEVYNADSLKAAPKFATYEVEDDQLIEDLASFAMTNAIYTALVEGYATEISARRNAMDNATSNSQSVMASLQMKFNRVRQAKITNDLVDIITGANAL
ncbi:ATP synthase F1, gamma subunit [Phakopsora pachyrhizi]|nr:ATP synthase F1, gamma subunit [Phakopsora pachyrhizi]